MEALKSPPTADFKSIQSSCGLQELRRVYSTATPHLNVSSSLPSPTTTPPLLLYISVGSILDFKGDAIVNAANNGGTGGFGVDEAVNRAGGFRIRQARKDKFGSSGIPTGGADYTESYGHSHRVKWIIHAVGPVYRVKAAMVASRGEGERGVGSKAAVGMVGDEDPWAEKDKLLISAYHRSLDVAQRLGCETVAFSLLSAGVFRGVRDLGAVLRIAVRAVLDWGDNEATRGGSVRHVHLVAYTKEEQNALCDVVAEMVDNTGEAVDFVKHAELNSD